MRIILIHEIELRTKSRTDFQDITSRIREIVTSDGIKNGLCQIFVPHTTAAVTINESADPSVATDITSQLDSLIPQQGNYRHLEGNSPAHIKASLVGSSEVVLVEDSKIILGTWQGIFFCEFDGPRTRIVIVKTIPD